MKNIYVIKAIKKVDELTLTNLLFEFTYDKVLPTITIGGFELQFISSPFQLLFVQPAALFQLRAFEWIKINSCELYP